MGEAWTRVTMRGGGRLTGAVSALALVSLCNAVGTAVHLAVGSHYRPSALHVATASAISAALTAWAFVRLRAARAAPARAPAGVFPAEIEPAPGPTIGVWSERVPTWLYRTLRWGRWVLALGLTAAAVVTLVDQWATLQSAFDQLGDPQWHWLRRAIYAEAVSTVAYAWMFMLLLRSNSVRLRLSTIVALTLAANALVVSLPAGVAWATAFSFAQLRRRGVPRATALAIPVLSTVISVATLASLLVIGVDLAGGSGPAAAFEPAALAGTGGICLALLAVLVLARKGKLPELRVERLAGAGVHISRRLFAAGFVPGLLNWAFDCGCLVCSILAVSGHVPWQGVLVAYGVGQIAANLPLTPGGIGVVEGTMSMLLVAYGMHSGTALAAVLLYRIISFWSLVPIGWAFVATLGRGRGPATLPAATARTPVSASPAATTS